MRVIDTNLGSKALTKEASILLAFAIFIVLLRFSARIQAGGLRRLRLDDWGMAVAATLFAFTITSIRLIAVTTHIDPTINPENMVVALSPGLDNDGMTDDYRANLNPASVEYQLRVAGSKLHVVAWSLYLSTLWCLKLCIAVYYTRLTDGLFYMRIRIQIAYIAIGMTYLVIIATIFGACRPFNHYWQINPNPGDQCMPAISSLWCYIFVVLNVLTDLYLLHIPIHMLWNAQISQSKKFFLVMLFSGGIFVIVAGILRAYFILSANRRGGAEAARWGIREAFVAFVIGNAPIIYGDGRISLRKSKQSKACTWILSRTKGWPVTDKLNALFSPIKGRRACTASEKATPGNNVAMQNSKAMIDSTSEQGHPSPLSREHPH